MVEWDVDVVWTEFELLRWSEKWRRGNLLRGVKCSFFSNELLNFDLKCLVLNRVTVSSIGIICDLPKFLGFAGAAARRRARVRRRLWF